MKYKHFVTIGHLDHGKSSTIGRLLWDMGKIGPGEKSYLKQIGGPQNRQFAYVLDHQQEERGRGITIDVGHSKLLVDGYSFIFADAPGHDVFFSKAYQGIEESDAAVLVIAADEGIKDQTKKHLEYARKVGIDEFIVCINKMDTVNYEEKIFIQIAEKILPLLQGVATVHIIPMSALNGENITRQSDKMPWFSGNTFLDSLKSVNATESSIDELVNQSKELIQNAFDRFDNPVMLWAGGKDSTAAVAIARELFDGKLPFPVLFIDTTWKFSETYEFIQTYAKKWKLNLQTVTNKAAIENGINPWSVDHFKYCHELKTKPLKKAIVDNDYDAVFTAIRWDEHGIRGKEQYFSARTDPPHTRVHPMLHFSETEIWKYLKTRGVAYNPLYDREEHNGLVYRSIGCWPFTKPIPKDEPEERAGRSLDKERLMENLRSLGYM